MASINLTWIQFEEIRKHLEAIYQAHALDADEGEIKNTIIKSEWDTENVEITIDLE